MRRGNAVTDEHVASKHWVAMTALVRSGSDQNQPTIAAPRADPASHRDPPSPCRPARSFRTRR